MKRLIYGTGLLIAMACPHLYAQTLYAVANVPFDFQMDNTRMPAGKYVVKESGGLLLVRGASGPKTAAAHLTFPVSRSARSSHAKLQFNRYGDEYFLAAIWDANSHGGHALTKGQHEKELASRHVFVQTASISLQEK
ncbi:MAG TPA: hypothetical protein VGK64_13455 [Bryobacteraceae bacterium]